MGSNYCMHCLELMGNENICRNRCGTNILKETPIHHLKPGTVLKEKYLIGRALGEGGFGITYIGRDLTLDMKVAVKEFYPNGYSHRNHNYTNMIALTQSNEGENFEKDMQRFLDEARILAKFADTPGIVGVRDYFRENNTAYIVMEYLNGITLKNYLQVKGVIPPNHLFLMMEPILMSLELIHNEDVIHRDISPDNIMLLQNGNLKLLDFGAARRMDANKSLSVVLKRGYAPEEQYRSKGHQGPWTDVYAMCATIYKCLTGITPLESLERVYEDELQPPSKLGIAITKKQEATLMRGLSIRIDDRIQNMAELRSGFESGNDTGESIQNIDLYKHIQADENKTVKDDKEDILVESDDKVTVPQGEIINFSGHGNVKQMPPEEETKRTEHNLDQLTQREPHPKKSSKLLLGAIAAMLVIALVLLPIVIGSRSDSVQVSYVDSVPTERIMASDSSTVLQWAEISGSVLDINIKDENLNEKFKTYIVTCEVTVLENNEERIYVTELYYEYDNEVWILSNLSKIIR